MPEKSHCYQNSNLNIISRSLTANLLKVAKCVTCDVCSPVTPLLCREVTLMQNVLWWVKCTQTHSQNLRCPCGPVSKSTVTFFVCHTEAENRWLANIRLWINKKHHFELLSMTFRFCCLLWGRWLGRGRGGERMMKTWKRRNLQCILILIPIYSYSLPSFPLSLHLSFSRHTHTHTHTHGCWVDAR